MWRLQARVAAAPSLSGDAVDIFVLGGSSAWGEPYGRDLGFAPWAAAMLGERVADRPVRIHLLAKRGASLYPQVEALRRVLPYRNRENRALVFVYAGHNEQLGPEDVADASGLTLRQRVTDRSLLLSSWRLEATRDRPQWRQRGLQHYAHYLAEVVSIAQDAGATPILSTVVSNLGGVEPSVVAASPEALRAAFATARAAEAEGDFARAQAAYEAIDAPDLRPLARFDAARMLRARGQPAHDAFLAAQMEARSDNFGRARPEQNDVIRALAAEHEVPLVDAERRFRAAHPDGIIDSRLFADGHHPNAAGYHLLAQGFAGAAAEVLGVELQRSDLPPEAWIGDAARFEAHIRSAAWLVSTAANHPGPREQLRLARAHVDAARAAWPEDPRALLLDGLVTAAAEHDLMATHAQELADDRLVWHWLEHCTDADQARAAAARFEGLGMDPGLITALQTAAQDLPERCG